MGFIKKLKTSLEDKGFEFAEQAIDKKRKKDNFKETINTNLTVKEQIYLSLFFLVFLIIGFVLSYFTYHWISNGLESKNWPSVEGIIISSEFISGRTSENKPTYSAEILYEYHIDNQKYLGNSVTSGGQSSSSSPSYAQHLVNKYHKGDKVNVYYNSNKPEQSVLEPSFHVTDALPFVMGIIFSLAGLVGVISVILGKKIIKVKAN